MKQHQGCHQHNRASSPSRCHRQSERPEGHGCRRGAGPQCRMQRRSPPCHEASPGPSSSHHGYHHGHGKMSENSRCHHEHQRPNGHHGHHGHHGHRGFGHRGFGHHGHRGFVHHGFGKYGPPCRRSFGPSFGHRHGPPFGRHAPLAFRGHHEDSPRCRFAQRRHSIDVATLDHQEEQQPCQDEC